jgi:hypothetical protein
MSEWFPPTGHPASPEEIERLTPELAAASREFVMQCCRPIYWYKLDPLDSKILNNGSITLIRTPKILMAVTAAHVVRGIEEDQCVRPIRVQIGDAVIDNLKNRIIAISDRLDLATVELDNSLISRIGRDIYPLQSWPPLVPQEGRGILLAGFPGSTRSIVGPRDVSFGPFMAMGIARIVSDEQITWVVEREFLIDDPVVKTMPPNHDLGGISGGPLIGIFETDNHFYHFRWCGIISQANASLENVVAKRADCITEDGFIRHY